MKRRLPAVACGLALLALPSAALAFKEPGHRGIEAAAYRQLLLDSSGTGKAQIRTLVEHGVLRAPGRPSAEPSHDLDPGYELYRVNSLIVQSHIPDHLMDRQLQADRQCFHFNARGAHLTLSSNRQWGIPRGLIEDAYVECLGVSDALLRGILYSPLASREQTTDLYSLMHMIEDSYSDAHVARRGPVAPGKRNEILFIKPWNLRTWSRYFLFNGESEPVRHHFSDTHHMGSDTRDLGYLIGPTDEDYDEKRKQPKYTERIATCLRDATPLIRTRAPRPIQLEDLYGDIVPPESCLSDRALAASDAIAALLWLVATYVPRVAAPAADPDPGVRRVDALEGIHFEDAWLEYRRDYLGHEIDSLTLTMTTPDLSEDEARRKQVVELDTRRDLVMSAKELAPKDFREAGFGLGVEVQGGTPLWLGLDVFVSRKGANHNRTIVLLDTLGWGIQARLPIENELGERPVGIAGDIGPGLPLPLSELISLDELQIYLGARLRLAYAAQAIFENESRHVLDFGFGGVSADIVVGKQAWLGLDLFRKMYRVDFWDPRQSGWTALTFGLSGGVAIDAL